MGSLLPKTSLNEIQYIINIYLGRMMVVGPRRYSVPILAGGVDYHQFVQYYAKRKEVRPGLPVWAQVSGLRGPTDQADVAVARIDHDLAHIQDFSIFLDLGIIIGTVWREFVSGSGF